VNDPDRASESNKVHSTTTITNSNVTLPNNSNNNNNNDKKYAIDTIRYDTTRIEGER